MHLLIGDKIKLCVFTITYLVLLLRPISLREQLDLLLRVAITCIGGDTLLLIASFGT
jgi:hypothetical protein